MNGLIVFQGKDIRRTLHNNEWYFSVEDVVFALTDSVNPKDYIKKIRKEMMSYLKGGDKLSPPLK